MRLLAILSALCTSGCASTLGIIHAASGQWPTSSSLENRTWLDGEPTRALSVEARFDRPLRAVCTERVHEPTSKVTSDSYGLDGGGRLAIGFTGFAELALAATIAFVPPADAQTPGSIVGVSLLGLDGLATLIMAFAIPDTHNHDERIDPARDYDVFACPADVGFEVEGQFFPVMADGRLSFDHNRALAEAVVFHNAPITLRFRGTVTTTFVPPEARCAWGYDNYWNVPDLRCPPRAVIDQALPR